MKFTIFYFTLASFLIASCDGFGDETRLEIDNLVENIFMVNNRIPGVGMSVVQNETVFMSKGYGMRNIARGLDSNENTLYVIGSISKSFLAVLVVKVLNEIYPQLGVTVLDIPVAQLIPSSVNFTLSDRYRAEYTTFRDILAHRTCLEGGSLDVVFGTISSGFEYALYLQQQCEFRNGYVYNNNLVSLAGETIAAIAGTTLAELIMDFVRDLGMVNTTYIDFNGSYESLPDMAWPYIIKNDTVVEFDMNQVRKTHVAVGAGGVISTPNDMVKYMNFHLNLGRLGDRQIVPENVMRWLYTVSNPLNFRGSRTEEVGSIVAGNLGLAQGFFSGLYDGWNIIHHSGYMPPYQCQMSLFPATKIGVFVCANGPGSLYNFPTHGVVASAIFELVRGRNESLEDILHKQGNIDAPLEQYKLLKSDKTNRNPTVLHENQMRHQVDSEEVLGLYGHPHHGDLTISYEPESGNTTLQINFSEWAIGRLHAVPGFSTTFSVEWKTSIMDVFYSYPGPVPDFWVDFGVADTVLFRAGEFDLYDEFEFYKNATLDTFPAIPWSPTSCGPEQETDL